MDSNRSTLAFDHLLPESKKRLLARTGLVFATPHRQQDEEQMSCNEEPLVAPTLLQEQETNNQPLVAPEMNFEKE